MSNLSKAFTEKANIFMEAKQEMEQLLTSLFGEEYEVIIRKKTNDKAQLDRVLYEKFCTIFNLDGSRKKEVVKYRHVLCYLLTEEKGYGFSQVGRLMGIDHSSVIHGKQRVINDLTLYVDDITPCIEEVRDFLNEWK